MSDTPETDMSERPTPRTASAMMELPGRYNSVWVVPAEIACDLESELNDAISERDEARELLASEKITRDHVIKRGIEVQKEREEAREQINELIYIAGRAIALAEIDFENDKFGAVSELRDGLERIKEGAK